MPEEEEQVVASTDHCRHCGAAKDVFTRRNAITGVNEAFEGGDDWLCAACEHWQDQMVCPTCHSVVRISLMPEDLAPKVARPQK